MRFEDIKFYLSSDYVCSPSDGELHWVDAGKLIQLYGLPKNQCVLIHRHWQTRGYRSQDHHIWLYPVSNGNYAEVLASALLRKGIKQ